MDSSTTQTLGGRVVAVTGASRGIGRAISDLLIASGATVIAGAREVVEMADPAARFVALDVASEASVRDFARIAAGMGVDSLVSNAGVGSFAPLEEFGVDEYRRIMDTNVLGMLLVCKYFIPEFRRRHQAGLRSHAVCVTSDAATRSFTHGGLYAASKHAQHALAQTLAREGEGYGLRVTEIRPGLTDTYFNGQEPGAITRTDHLRARDVAEAVCYALAAPPHVRVDEIVLHPVVQPVVY